MHSQSMEDDSSKRLQNFRQHASGVSRALWPADLRRSLATGRVSRRRRFLNNRGKYLWATSLNAGTSLALMLISLFVVGTIVIALIWRLWYVLLIPAVILTVTTFLITPLLLVKLSRTFSPAGLRPSRELRDPPFFPAMHRSPETPLPAAPLVRVLETYDLSQSSTEHFLDPATPEHF